MQITASLVKELRERTGAGMMDCKKVLQETGGDIEIAIENMRKSGISKAAKKAGRITAEGIIIIRQASDGNDTAILEINCETDFVAKDNNFRQFANTVADAILLKKPSSIDELLKISLNDGDGQSIEDVRTSLVGKVGENISIRRFITVKYKGVVGSYLHGLRIGVVVELSAGDNSLGKDIAMHIAASKPVCVSQDQVPELLLEKEKNVFKAQAEESGKPAEIIEKIVEGKIDKFLNEITLVGQPFIKDPDITVGKLLELHNASVNSFIRYEVGEGIEKKEDNFVKEVMTQANG